MVSSNTAALLLLSAAQGSAEAMLKLSSHDIHRHLSNQLGGVNSIMPKHAPSRNREMLEDNCPGTPLLWKIVDNESGNHVGFGLGTIHLPTELVLKDSSKESIMNAIQDSCNVYGEVNLLDPAVQLELQECTAPFISTAAKVSDIPDEDLKAAYEAKLLEIATAVASDEPLIGTIYQSLSSLPLFLVQ